MHDARTLIDMGEDAVRRLARRNYKLDLEALRDLVESRARARREADALRAQSRQAAAQARGDDAARSLARELKERIQQTEAQFTLLDTELRELLLAIPNLPLDAIPDGNSDDDAVEIRRHGAVPVFDFTPRDHADLAEAMGILDLARASKLSGARFSVARGAGAALERALAAFFLDLHTRRHGYTEYSVPFLVNRATMTGTGQLPKFEDDLFVVRSDTRELFLVPTAEVPLTNLHAGETLDPSALPLAYVAHTPCFRAEAGSYGRDTRGVLRLHQFSKVELVRVCAAGDSAAELETLVGHAEACLKELGLAYRVVTLAAGDTGFSAQITHDLEVWLPGQNRYREISSCSDCGVFQARRASIRVRGHNGDKPSFAATLNGSGLPIGRTMAAVLEQYQRADGSVDVPEALVPYLGHRRIGADGTLLR